MDSKSRRQRISSIGIVRLKAGEFNNMSQEQQDDGSVIVTLVKRGESKVYKFRVKDLYGENEEVLWEEVIERGMTKRGRVKNGNSSR